MTPLLRVLYVDDSEADRLLMSISVDRAEAPIELKGCTLQSLSKPLAEWAEVLLIDVNLDGGTVLDALETLEGFGFVRGVVVLTGASTIDGRPDPRALPPELQVEVISKWASSPEMVSAMIKEGERYRRVCRMMADLSKQPI